MEESTRADPRTYRAIRLWHLWTGSLDPYIRALQRRASDERAPTNALYRPENGRWVTVDDLSPGHRFREMLTEHLAGRGQWPLEDR